ncbi:serine hydrolase domain-containing protein [Actinoplanes lobatus]|uniref:D-alanyl-D-alanine carboxypeptidase n=1 Tax=Actinoplanes lobatus TaxID=113568 RepID=A0A7W7HMR9_9ACTN|nr:serine hydrolase domain-containing protein [Actinoplanes lobatus]MBB4753388.1 D-alanyl-D-alanine carboxypeptidase [Actinoplanes lobatus]GIE37923.1 D-alanyl-D-alanine carboxypeptidase [Actinoplanes lobatus]
MIELRRLLDELVGEGAVGVLAEFRDGAATWRLSSGVAELGTGRPVDPVGWFRIGSVTKLFVTAVTLQLVGEGRLALDEPVEGGRITVRQLLNHTSGLYNYTLDLTTEGILRDRFRQWTPEEVVASARNREPDFPPGASRAYNNTGYVLLGMLIERVTGRSYRAEVEQRILRPLDLRRTRADDHGTRLPEPHAHAYLDVDGVPVDITECSPSQAGAAGGMVSTAADLNRFLAALMAGDLLGDAEQREMRSTVATDIAGVDGGLGVNRYTLPNGAVVWGKEGGFHGFRTWVFHQDEPARQLAVSMTVAGEAGPATHELLARAAEVFTPAARG